LLGIALMIAFTRWDRLPWWAVVLLAISFLLAAWAVNSMRLGNFNIVPDPVKSAHMITKGPYRMVRHPMYASLFLMAFALDAAQIDYYKFVTSVLLVSVLTIKMLYEERLLCKHFPGYRIYMQKTKRVIPFVW